MISYFAYLLNTYIRDVYYGQNDLDVNHLDMKLFD